MTQMTESVRQCQMFVGGQWVDASGGTTITTLDPSTEQPLAEIPAASEEDVDFAVRAAAAAQPGWEATPWPQRASALRELAGRLREQARDLAMLDATDAGLPLTGMLGDVSSAANELEYFAGLGGESKGHTMPSPPGQVAFTQLEPYGVVGRIIPFNHPLMFAAGKVAAPLMAGNAVILKPGEHSCLSALELARITEDLLPAGVLNVVTGVGHTAGAALVAHPEVPRIAFTGSVAAGKAVLRSAAEHIKHVTVELGGKNPMVVFPDADIARAARAAVDGMNLRRTMGQSCQSNSRVFVHERIKGPFLEELQAVISRLTVGDPREESTDLGPLAFREHYNRVLGYVEAGTSDGASLVCGGRRPSHLDRGFYLEPTVFADVDPHMRIAQEEIFGPVVSVLDWSDYEEMIAAANGVEYGLTANIWTNDLTLAHHTARRIQSGLVWINGNGKKPPATPFGGYKHSGLGKEGSLEELLSYSQSKSVVANLHLDRVTGA